MKDKIFFDQVLDCVVIPSGNTELAIAISDYKNDNIDYLKLRTGKNLPNVTMYPSGSIIETFVEGELIIVPENDYSHVCHNLHLKHKDDENVQIIGKNFKIFMLNLLLGNYDKINPNDYCILKSLGIIHLAENKINTYCIPRGGLRIYDIDKILRPLTKNIIQLPHDIEFSYKLYLLDNYKLGREYRNLDIVDILNVIACEWDGYDIFDTPKETFKIKT